MNQNQPAVVSGPLAERLKEIVEDILLYAIKKETGIPKNPFRYTIPGIDLDIIYHAATSWLSSSGYATTQSVKYGETVVTIREIRQTYDMTNNEMFSEVHLTGDAQVLEEVFAWLILSE
jgi:hypothetical protein